TRSFLDIDEFFHVPTVVRPGETLSSTHFERRAGGKGANQASAAAKAGGRVKLIGAVGDDGGWLRDGMAQAGVDVDDVFVSRDFHHTHGAATVLHKGANYLTAPLTLSFPPQGLAYTHLLLQNEIPWECTLAYLLHARQSGATAVWNPSPMPSAAQLQAFPWNHLEWLLVNEGEVADLLRALGGAGPALAAVEEEDADKVAHARRLLSALHASPFFAPTLNVVCTLGGAGLVALLHGSPTGAGFETVHVPAATLDGPVRDTTGAGDCFTGYFVAGLMEEGVASGLGARVSRAGVAAGLCVQRPGAVESIPRREEVDERRTALQNM
ncbi:hypothetical protein PHLGIDRAFT_71523, partial [Phlebiopsis gigantea 11061_1 CR5-6]